MGALRTDLMNVAIEQLSGPTPDAAALIAELDGVPGLRGVRPLCRAAAAPDRHQSVLRKTVIGPRASRPHAAETAAVQRCAEPICYPYLSHERHTDLCRAVELSRDREERSRGGY